MGIQAHSVSNKIITRHAPVTCHGAFIHCSSTQKQAAPWYDKTRSHIWAHIYAQIPQVLILKCRKSLEKCIRQGTWEGIHSFCALSRCTTLLTPWHVHQPSNSRNSVVEGVLRRFHQSYLIRIKDASIILISQEISRILGAECQKWGTKTKYLSLFYYSLLLRSGTEEQQVYLFFYFFNFKIFNSYVCSQTWTPLPPPSP